MSADPRLRAKLFELYDRHYQRALAGGSLANIADPTKMPRHHLRMWDRTYGHLIRSLPHGSEVLDLGCGTGLFLHWLRRYANIRACGVDISAAMVQIARMAVPECEVVCADALKFLESNLSRFSGIFSFHVLEHIPDNELLVYVEACRNALRQGGFFCVEVPNASNCFVGGYHRHHDLTHVRGFTAESLLQLFEAAGFENCFVVPQRPGRFLGWIRQSLEHILHKCLFLVSNCVAEKVFTPVVAVVGYRSE